MNKTIKRSPLFYVGDKYKLMKQLIDFFPKEIDNFYEPFTGGGTVFLNIEAKKYYLNDIDKNLMGIHKFLIESSKNPDKFFKDVEKIIYKYNLSRSYKEDVIPALLRQEFKKTYFAKYNKEGYEELKKRVNKNIKNDPLILYILLIYGFNRMLRFNGGGKFNLPVGNVDFNKNVLNALNNYFNIVKERKTIISVKDFRKFFASKKITENDFVYLDPPYLITFSEYNKIWNEESEKDLLKTIDELNKRKIRFALSNVTHYNGSTNGHLIKWMKKYKVYKIKSNYISYHNNGKKDIKEVLVTNY
ncbi:MAG: Dam family site-specific DNA-(adenine-N6)-methyltransferase [Patescibacteria group bacterium]|jgi:DNA adenine methylase|nr:Dam family site-specific DNA-(adenine-N6)-methyltransferase [Patescibacteria group bacterium]